MIKTLLQYIQHHFANLLYTTISIADYAPVHGGDINEAFILNTNAGKFFIKINAATGHADMFEKEAKGLTLLAGANCIAVPKPLLQGNHNEYIFLITEYIEKGNPRDDFWESFGRQLAQLHRHTNTYFGLDHNNYIGSLSQYNPAQTRWSDFYAQRIMSLAVIANEKSILESRYIIPLEKLSGKLAEIFPEEPPALLHGDLWSGNFIVKTNGLPAIFDPAVYYGHREMDIGMSLLFGGFDRKMYEAYHYHYPLQPGWEQRIQLCQLYPLLVHLVLFGGHYHGQVVDIMRRYIL